MPRLPLLVTALLFGSREHLFERRLELLVGALELIDLGVMLFLVGCASDIIAKTVRR